MNVTTKNLCPAEILLDLSKILLKLNFSLFLLKPENVEASSNFIS